jgi:hypothetical protein
MTIKTKEPDLPTEFPPARLFLDDIEEIVRILVDSNKNSHPSGSHDENAKLRAEFTVKDQVCNEVEELHKIAKKTTELLIRLEWETGFTASTLIFYRNGTLLSSYFLEREGHLSLFHKLAPIFRRRNLWFRTLVHSRPALFPALVVLWLSTIITWLIFTLNKRTPPILAAATVALMIPILITFLAARIHHTTIIMRHSSEPSALRQELLHKFPLVAISSVLTFLLTLLGLYLKHKYWP